MLRVVVSFVLVVVAGTARAETEHFSEASSPMHPDYDTPFHLLPWTGRLELEDRGLTIDPVYAIELFASPPLDDQLVAGGLFVLELDADLDTLVSSRLGHVHATALAIHGGGPNNELGDVHNSSGNTAPPDVRMFEAWYEQPLGPLALRLGLLSADQQFWVARQATTLIGATFGMPGQFGYTVGNPAYPVGRPAASLGLELSDVTGLVAVFDGSDNDVHGIPTGLGPDVLAFGELAFAELLHLGAWHHSTDGNGVYGMIDADIGDHLGFFTRAGLSDTVVPIYIDAGARHTSPRAGDVMSAGLAFARSDQGAQTIVEATYAAVFGWLTIQPDLQVLFLRDRTVGIAATRMTFVF